MRKRSKIDLLAGAAALFAASIAGNGGGASAGEVDAQDFTTVARGRYLSILSDCASCHTVPKKSQPFAGGRPIETPFGKIVAPNITPDMETGIGSWTDDQFDNAVRKGIGRNGERLYPAMPFNAYTKMSREDVLAIRAYLNTVTAVYNPVVANTLPFPFNIRTSMRVWDGLYFKEGEYVADPHKSAEWNRGAFLVDGPAHCGACHTPKSFLGGDKTAQYLQGSPLQGWSAPNITNDARTGLGGWSVEEVAAYLKTGHNRVTAATGPMAEAVDLSTSKMTDDDVKAIATYLKSLPGDEKPRTAMAASAPEMMAGGAIYRDQCSACHGLDGKGIDRLFPSVANSSMARADDPTSVIRIVLRGARSVATDKEPTAPGMPSYGWQLNDGQVANVLNYIRNSWGNAAPAVSPDEVGRLRKSVAKRSD
jgi:mono/diheme cytochrome c family protein